jgi:hypothetical protein
MSEDIGPKFKCTACGREFKWKPELAGKKAKCKCGAAIAVPATAPGAAVEDELDLGDLPEPISPRQQQASTLPPPPLPPQQLACPICNTPAPPTAVLCTSCGYNFRTGVRLPGAGRGTALAYATKGSATTGGFSADTFAQAAKASWIAPLVALGLGCCTSSAQRTMPAVGMVIGISQLLLVAGGIACGIFALVGVGKHGAEGLLFPAVVGLVLNVLFIGLVVVVVIMITSGRLPAGRGPAGGPMPPPGSRGVPVMPRGR